MKKFKENFRDFFEENITGILATIVFHLLLFIVFLVIKISASSSFVESEILIDFSESEELFEPEEKRNDEKNEDMKGFEEVYEQMQGRNIAVNVKEQFKEEISTNKYVEQIMDEYDIEDLNPDVPFDDLLSYEEIKTDKAEDTDINETGTYSGITNILYDVEGRTGKYIHIPVYKCEGGGKVVVDIAVNQKGKVVDAAINKTFTEVHGLCLNNAAISAAYRSVFNIDFNAPLRQHGTITYIFIPQ